MPVTTTDDTLITINQMQASLSINPDNSEFSEISETKQMHEMIQKDIVEDECIDTNNNTRGTALEVYDTDIHKLPNCFETKCPRNATNNGKSNENGSIQLLSKGSSAIESSNVYSSGTETKLVSDEDACDSHKSRPLIIHPILKHLNVNNWTSLGNTIEGQNCDKIVNAQANSTKTASSVSFLLPTHLSSTHSNITDSDTTSKENSLLTDKSTGIKLISALNDISVTDGFKSFRHMKTASPVNALLPISPPCLSDSDISEYEATIHEVKVAANEIEATMKPPINVEEGGRYSILNPDFSPKVEEDSAWMAEIKSMRNEITSQKNKCLMGAINVDFSPKTSSIKMSSKHNEGYDEDSSGESTDTLLEEARQYLTIAKEKLVTLEDWKIIDQNKKEYKRASRVRRNQKRQ